MSDPAPVVSRAHSKSQKIPRTDFRRIMFIWWSRRPSPALRDRRDEMVAPCTSRFNRRNKVFGHPQVIILGGGRGRAARVYDESVSARSENPACGLGRRCGAGRRAAPGSSQPLITGSAWAAAARIIRARPETWRTVRELATAPLLRAHCLAFDARAARTSGQKSSRRAKGNVKASLQTTL